MSIDFDIIFKLQLIVFATVQGTDASCHYLLHFPICSSVRMVLLDVINGIDTTNDSETNEVLLYGKRFLNKT